MDADGKSIFVTNVVILCPTCRFSYYLYQTGTHKYWLYFPFLYRFNGTLQVIRGFEHSDMFIQESLSTLFSLLEWNNEIIDATDILRFILVYDRAYEQSGITI